MGFEIVPLITSVGTVGTSIGFLSSVSPLVALQLVPRLEGFVADGAHMAAMPHGCRCTSHRVYELKRDKHGMSQMRRT